MNIYDLAIIGSGPAGYAAAGLAGRNGLKIILFEKNNIGGVCLNEGCIPTKTLLYSAKIYQHAKESEKYGVSCDAVAFDLPKIIARKNKIVRKLAAGIRAGLNDADVETVGGEAIVRKKGDGQNAMEIECNGQTYSARKLLIATGSETIIPPISGLAETGFWTSREALETKEIPESLLIIGGGVIGIEFASFFNTLGSRVTVVEMANEILTGMDGELSALLRNELTKQGIEFRLNTTAVSVSGRRVEMENANGKSVSEFSKTMVSVGRKPVLTGFGLETLDLELRGNGLKVDEYMQTSRPGVYACGDVTGFSLLAHTAVREAEVAVGHMLGKNEKMSYKAVPGVVYTNPEMAGAGKTEEVLRAENIAYATKRLPMTYSGRFTVENEQGNGICKILAGEDGAILGVHILGNPASEIIVVAGIAIEKGLTVEDLRAMIFPHPTVGEIIKEVSRHCEGET
ncbi:MAG: dihydrolipoyl dehydrogenase [Dysgonamonadaceae bacterium]|jgi:dihydrolipoamide dehydrogenase|nr:dihydrolipoyl dehydrogenase [Dysgonamonadaceae bacterium]